MNIKSELQSNNTDLQTVLDKVNALPDAGGGGVETCTVSFTSCVGVCYYVDGNTQQLTEVSTGSRTITVPVNSIIVLYDWNALTDFSGSGSRLFDHIGASAYFITGNCSFVFSDEPA